MLETLSKADLLDKMREGRTQFAALIGQLSDEQMLTPSLDNGWTVKDVLAHVAWWANYAAGVIDALMDGRTPDVEKPETDEAVDALNAAAFARYQDMPVNDVLVMEQESYTRLLAAANRTTDDDLNNRQRFDWTKGRQLFVWIGGNSFWHYDEHVPALRQYIESLKGSGN